MKKKIPKFDQKAWDEKQAKVAEEANDKGSTSPFLKTLKQMEKMNKDWLDSHTYGWFLPPVPKDKLSAKFPPSGITSGAALRARQPTGYLPYVPVGDPFDKYLFGGEDGDRDKDLRLPQGYGYQTPWINFDPSVEPKQICCTPETKVNVGFMQDKWACKICGKDM